VFAGLRVLGWLTRVNTARNPVAPVLFNGAEYIFRSLHRDAAAREFLAIVLTCVYVGGSWCCFCDRGHGWISTSTLARRVLGASPARCWRGHRDRIAAVAGFRRARAGQKLTGPRARTGGQHGAPARAACGLHDNCCGRWPPPCCWWPCVPPSRWTLRQRRIARPRVGRAGGCAAILSDRP